MSIEITDNLLKELIELCKCEVSISVNTHRNYYETVEDNLRDVIDNKEVSDEVYQEMKRRDTVIRVQAYPDTPVGFYSAYHWDISIALQEVIESIKAERK